MDQASIVHDGSLAIIIPSFNEENCIKETCERVRAIMLADNIPYKMIFVDDL